ncbi:Potassium voltage-gated channel protein eag [Symbiodinium microadriaticum]|uniref:Potassium voltage-gated channel protein eag n=1 Tax=Symbiodinium microadriaticum TaxID=2951 RepID=A0A1Q9EDT5_SYMMI|nr:Potassium voltage-gated channel protein eag [Symbiodinium microadriaticum]
MHESASADWQKEGLHVTLDLPNSQSLESTKEFPAVRHSQLGGWGKNLQRELVLAMQAEKLRRQLSELSLDERLEEQVVDPMAAETSQGLLSSNMVFAVDSDSEPETSKEGLAACIVDSPTLLFVREGRNRVVGISQSSIFNFVSFLRFVNRVGGCPFALATGSLAAKWRAFAPVFVIPLTTFDSIGHCQSDANTRGGVAQSIDALVQILETNLKEDGSISENICALAKPSLASRGSATNILRENVGQLQKESLDCRIERSAAGHLEQLRQSGRSRKVLQLTGSWAVRAAVESLVKKVPDWRGSEYRSNDPVALQDGPGYLLEESEEPPRPELRLEPKQLGEREPQGNLVVPVPSGGNNVAADLFDAGAGAAGLDLAGRAQFKPVEKGCSGLKQFAISWQLPSVKVFDKYLLNPNWTSKMSWDFFVMFLVVLDSIILPFQLAFKYGMPDDGFDVVWFYVTTIVFFTDVGLSFNTAIERKDSPGTWILSRKRIACLYLKGWFSIDFFSTVPYGRLAESIFGDNGGAGAVRLLKMLKFLRIMRLMKMLRMSKLKAVWERIEVRIGSIAIIQSIMLMKVLAFVIAMCHWNACLFWVIGSTDSILVDIMPAEMAANFRSLNHWTTLPRKDGPYSGDWTYMQKPMEEQYIFCFYWTLGVMRTMPAEVNFPERIFVLLFMFFALSAFAVSVASLTQAYFKIFERGRSFNDEMFFVRMFEAAKPLEQRVKAFLAPRLTQRRSAVGAVYPCTILHSTVLKNEVQNMLISFHLQNLDIIKDHMPGVVICTMGQAGNCNREGAAEVRVELFFAPWENGDRIMTAEGAGRAEAPTIVDRETLTTPEPYRSPLTIQTATVCELLQISKALKWTRAEHLMLARNDAGREDAPGLLLPLRLFFLEQLRKTKGRASAHVSVAALIKAGANSTPAKRRRTSYNGAEVQGVQFGDSSKQVLFDSLTLADPATTTQELAVVFLLAIAGNVRVDLFVKTSEDVVPAMGGQSNGARVVCTCPDFLKAKAACKHLLFVFLRDDSTGLEGRVMTSVLTAIMLKTLVLTALRTMAPYDPRLWQRALIPRELSELRSRPGPEVQAPAAVRDPVVQTAICTDITLFF